MEHPEPLDAARALRRSVLGDAYVDAQAADPNPTMAEFQEYLTDTAWGVWARGGPLTTRDLFQTAEQCAAVVLELTPLARAFA